MKNLLQLFSVLLIFTGPCLNLGCGETRNNDVPDAGSVGEVIKIVDGDTYDLLIGGNKVIRIRMAGIDAPERGQPYYRKAKDYLGRLCFRKVVRIEKIDKDRYGRTIAWSYGADGVSLSAEMVKNGFAWHFKKYDNSPELAELENEARRKHIGIWEEKDAVAPWDKRAGSKKAATNAMPQ